MTPFWQWATGASAKGYLAMPAWLAVAVVVLPALGLALWAGAWWHRRALRAIFGRAMLRQVVPRSVRVRRTVRASLWILAIAAGLVALAGPRHSKRVDTVEQEGVDLVLAVDLSLSMDAGDVDPSRLVRAQREILDLLDLLEGDRVGLVIYAGGAYPRMPLSRDHDALRMLVGELSTDIFKAQGSALDEAIRVGVRLLTADKASRAGKALLLFTDGEAHDQVAATEAAQEAADLGVRIYGVAIGEGPAVIPTRRGSITDGMGQMVMSRPNPDLLDELAQLTGGATVKSVADDSDMASLYIGGVRADLDAVQTGSSQRERWTPAHGAPLLLAVLAGLLAAWLGEGRRRWGAALALLLALGLTSSTVASAGMPEGDAAFRQGNFRRAVEEFTALAMERPDDPDVLDRLGAARYRAGDFEGAARAWDRANRLGEPTADSLFNAGNAHYQGGRLGRALERYEQTLAVDPTHPGALANKQLLEQELQLREQIEPPPPPQESPQESEPEQGEPQEGEPQEGESQDGELQEGEGQQGDTQEGESQEGEPEEGEPEEGEPQEGEAGEGEAEGDPSEGQRERDGENPTQLDGGKKPGSEGQDLEESDNTEGEAMADGEGQEGEASESETSASDGPISKEQAEKKLEGVQEGRPRVRIPGRRTDKPW